MSTKETPEPVDAAAERKPATPEPGSPEAAEQEETAAFDEAAAHKPAEDAKQAGAEGEEKKEPEKDEEPAKAEDEEPEKDEEKTKKEPAAEEKAAAAFWEEVAKTHPRAEKDVEDPRFDKFLKANPRIARLAKSTVPAVAVEVMEAYYEARDTGELDKEPEPPKKEAPAEKPAAEQAPAPKTVAERLDEINDLVVTDEDGIKRTIADIRKESGDEYPRTVLVIAEALRKMDRAPAEKDDTATKAVESLQGELKELRFSLNVELERPGTMRTARSAEMREWLKSEPPSVQRMYRSNEPEDLIFVVDRYEAAKKNEKTEKERGSLRDKKTRKDNLHGETVRGGKATPTPSSAIPDDAEHEEELFEEAASKAGAGLVSKGR